MNSLKIVVLHPSDFLKPRGFKINPNMPIKEAITLMLQDFLSMNLNTRHKVKEIDAALQRVMEYYEYVGKTVDRLIYIKVMDYSEASFNALIWVKWISAGSLDEGEFKIELN